ncbi:helix-turn-helix domain-containing protein [Devosia chinhatensis]|uniref:Chromosomal replication initiator DnaA C-terminal domain-containing protein n=1 Tax=Devosia chinhatensis TaxID=429727 RepID=A0A0F5FKK7_9HYPH|nr:helix-turn-helix domain-containing protein [Devosia chinhatensis]KKB09386.1 hypothetical protein VE26_05465 [Devosia chinhatensis]
MLDAKTGSLPNSRSEMIKRAVIARRRLMSGKEPPSVRANVRIVSVVPIAKPPAQVKSPRKRSFIDLYATGADKWLSTRRRHAGLMPNWPPNAKELRAAEQRVEESLKLRPVLLEVAERHKVSVKAILARGRRPSVVKARQEFSYIACELLGFSLIAAGLILGQDRSTIRHGVAVHRQTLAALPEGKDR